MNVSLTAAASIKHQKYCLTIIILIIIIGVPLFYISYSNQYQSIDVNSIDPNDKHLQSTDIEYVTVSFENGKKVITTHHNKKKRNSHATHDGIMNRLKGMETMRNDNINKSLPKGYHKPNKFSNSLNIVSPNHPSIVVIGSTKGGTTTLINIMNNHLLSFYTPKRTDDLHYWTKCLPCNGIYGYNHGMNVSDIVSKWDVDPNNLCTRQEIKCTINDYMHKIIQDKRARNIDLYIAERTSGYMKSPYIAKLFAVHFPSTILLYSIREKLTQKYSRWYTFHPKKQTVNMAFEHGLELWRSQRFQERIWPLVKRAKQDEGLRKRIVYEFISYPLDDGKLRHVLSDMCPYLNVLVYVEILEMFNREYGFRKFKIIQSEWMFENVFRSAVYLHCIVKIDDSTSQSQFDECSGGEDIENVVSKESENKLKNNSFHKSVGYIYSSVNIELFDGMSEYVGICDLRLFELIKEEKYKSLTVGSDWDYDRWLNKRQVMRQQLLRK